MSVISIFIGIVVGTLILSEAVRAWQKRLAPQRLALIARHKLSEDEKELALPFMLRVIRPLAGNLSQWIGQFAPMSMQTSVGRELVLAGWQGRFRPVDFILLRWFLMLVLPLMGWLVLRSLEVPPRTLLMQLMFAFVLGWRGPMLFLRRAIARRTKAIEKDLPYTIDLLVVSAEAGLGFDGAVQRVVQRTHGPLCEELNRVLQDMRLGKPRQDAWQGLRDRTNVPELTSFVNAVIQASQLGLSLSTVLRTQSDMVRQRRRENAEAQARKMPVKMLFPLIFFILPALFVVVLGPAVILVVESFQFINS